jgi:hypothetical protein
MLTASIQISYSSVQDAVDRDHRHSNPHVPDGSGRPGIRVGSLTVRRAPQTPAGLNRAGGFFLRRRFKAMYEA